MAFFQLFFQILNAYICSKNGKTTDIQRFLAKRKNLLYCDYHSPLNRYEIPKSIKLQPLSVCLQQYATRQYKESKQTKQLCFRCNCSPPPKKKAILVLQRQRLNLLGPLYLVLLLCLCGRQRICHHQLEWDGFRVEPIPTTAKITESQLLLSVPWTLAYTVVYFYIFIFLCPRLSNLRLTAQLN